MCRRWGRTAEGRVTAGWRRPACGTKLRKVYHTGRIQDRFVLRSDLTLGLSATMRRTTRILLALIFLVPILWVWPQRGISVAFYTNPHWSNGPALVRVERQINLDFMTADSVSLPQQEFSVEWNGW